MAAPLTPAQREELSAEAYSLSLRGFSAREIGRQLDVSHKTVSSYVKAESERRAAERPDYRQFALDSHRQAIRRCWDELDKNPSPHATAQLLHALNAGLSSIELIAGVRAPTKHKTETRHELQDFDPDRLSEAEAVALGMLLSKMEGKTEADVVAVIAQRHEAGDLVFGSEDLIELEPVEEDLPNF